MKQFLTGNHAVAEAVRLSRPGIVAAYPITPQTPIYEKLSETEASGNLEGIMMRMESEHSAMAACISASLTGARTFTATSSQGLALMHEMLHFAAGARTPVVMACVNRTLALPWAFWSDQTDSLSQRDTGWIQIYVENNQEAADSIFQAFRIAETVMLPCMVVLEANFISHFMEPVDFPEPEQVNRRVIPPVGVFAVVIGVKCGDRFLHRGEGTAHRGGTLQPEPRSGVGPRARPGGMGSRRASARWC